MRDFSLKIFFATASLGIWYAIFSLIPLRADAQTPDVRALIEKKLEGNPDREAIIATIRCESDFNPLAVGDHGMSRGLVQIHGPSWPTISPAEAFDPSFAMDFIIQQFKAGHARYWTCYRRLALLY